MRELRGVLHVHSTFSDGEMDLANLALAFRQEGYHFVCLTEHAEDLDPEQMAVLVKRCRGLSDDRFCLIPGLEFDTRESIHVLGIGLSRYVSERSAQEILAAIHGQGGLAILAHPARGVEQWLTGNRDFPDGLELWNTKHDSRYAPRRHRFSMLRRMRTLRSDIWGYCAVDFHWMNQYRKASVVVRADRVVPDAILGALRTGRFVGQVGRTTLDPRGDLAGLQALSFGLREWGVRLFLLLLRGMKRTARALRLPLPKRHLRAIVLRIT